MAEDDQLNPVRVGDVEFTSVVRPLTLCRVQGAIYRCGKRVAYLTGQRDRVSCFIYSRFGELVAQETAELRQRLMLDP